MIPKILVIDDDNDIRNLISVYLENEGMETIKVADAIKGLEFLKSNDVDLIILDIMMPKMDGIQACLKIREEKSMPIIMLSAKSEDIDKIQGLTSGADDYLSKPFNPLELIARVKSQLRRYVTLGNFNKEEEKEVLKSGGLELNTKNKEVFVDGESIKLTPIEFKILELLLKNKGRVFSMEEIYERVWNETSYNVDNTVAVHIRRIREKIEINPKEPKYLKVVWGIGYKIDKC
ncbi:response regulator transcription factor [Clostridium sp. UBA5119]|uniref:response regulator transcription factor n=1 Tax=Clostridium sp. UBA5119 TaxID=1946366 RepID=UPI0039C873CE